MLSGMKHRNEASKMWGAAGQSHALALYSLFSGSSPYAFKLRASSAMYLQICADYGQEHFEAEWQA